MTTTDMPAASRRLTRSRDDRIVAGVCSGAARYWDIDPVIPRVILAVLAVFGGAGIAVYALAWLLIPEDGTPSTRFERWLEGKNGDRGRDVLIVVLALFVVGILFGTNPFAHRVSAAALLIVLALTASAIASRRKAAQSGHPWQRQAATPTDTMPFGPTAAPYGPYPEPTVAMPMPMPVAPRRPRSWLGWATIGVALLVAGSFSAVAAAGWAHPQPADVIAASIAVLGVGLLAGTFFGRAWSLIPLGLLLTGALLIANALPRNLTWTAGTRYWSPTEVSSHGYVLGTGKAHLDLRGLDTTRSVGTTVDSRIGAGKLIVVVPSNVTVVVHASVNAGRVEMFGVEQNGTGVDVNRTFPGPAKNPRTLTVNIAMGFGDVEVQHAAA